jgi:hypothetical protein
MNTTVWCSRIGLLLLFAACGRQTELAPRPSSAAAPAKSAACAAPEFRQLDFWIGDWDAFEAGKPAAVARTRVDPILGGCVLRERYDGVDGLAGQSFSIYDASRGVWHQTWVTNRGRLLTIEGGRQGDQMLLAGRDQTEDGKQRHVRGTWQAVPGGVREIATVSTDGGKTWTPWFDLMFRPHRS